MSRSAHHLKIAAVLWIGAFTLPASAQQVCSEGRTQSGQCVHRGLASAARTTAIVLGQTRLSFSILPVLPSQDHGARDPTVRLNVGREVSVIHP